MDDDPTQRRYRVGDIGRAAANPPRADAFDHLSRLGLHALLDIGTTGFWRRLQPPASSDVETFDRCFEVRIVANELLGVEGHDRALMAPKPRAKAQAISASASGEQVFRVRALSSQIGGLETSMAHAAAQSVSNAELLLSTGASERSVAIDHQLKVFESYEQGFASDLGDCGRSDPCTEVPRLGPFEPKRGLDRHTSGCGVGSLFRVTRVANWRDAVVLYLPVEICPYCVISFMSAERSWRSCWWCQPVFPGQRPSRAVT